MSAQRNDELWQYQAACRGPHSSIFYPPAQVERRIEKRRREERAKEVCAGCPVRLDCLDHAVTIGEQHGIWGGLTAKERRTLLATG